ncbi:uncharacterized protein LOC133886481 [Phragmites australis]|uniref:uncharacterized protein LOC133886481 n=1 Tax=Phragmites australis TaxID=29695 RepID=UPI002D791E09|nr:uncharacterized protein LOC133886481 [Phragmites australis]
MDPLPHPPPSLSMLPTRVSTSGEEETLPDKAPPTSSDSGISPWGSLSSNDKVWDEFIDEPMRAKKAWKSSLEEEADEEEEEDDTDADADSGDKDSDDEDDDDEAANFRS